MLFTLLPAGAVTLVGAAVALVTGYLALLTILALVGRRLAPPAGPATRHFAVLIPAHNEELLIGRLLTSLSELDYPADRVDVCVVADNCEDTTAHIARSFGARVYERFDSTQRAKGFALRWLLERLRAENRRYDAFVVLDADSIVSPNLLRRMDAHLESGSEVVQAYYSVLNAGASHVAGLRYAALAAVHYLRPLGRSVVGLSCGLKGNGMCFAAPVLERFAWQWYTLAEDVEFHLALVGQSVRVDFAPDAVVLADMPVTLAQASSQNARWERGRLQLIRERVPRLVRDGVRRRSLLRLDAAIEQLIPPLSVLFASAGACLGFGLALGAPAAVALGGLGLAGQVAYLLAALALVRAPRHAYLALAAAPLYVLWKVAVYGRSLAKTRGDEWVRTTRTLQSGAVLGGQK